MQDGLIPTDQASQPRQTKGIDDRITYYHTECHSTKASIPTFLYISNAKVHDVNILDLIQYESGSYYVVDKAYIDFRRLYKLHTRGAYFVTRAKNNMRFKRMYSKPVDKTMGIKYDQIGKLETYYPKKDYPDKLRRVKYFDQENILYEITEPGH